MRIGILNSGGDCPGLNAVIHGVVGAATELGWEVIGFRNGFEGLLPNGPGHMKLDTEKTLGILSLGGTILGTTNKGNFAAKVGADSTIAKVPKDIIEQARVTIKYLGIEALIVVGGDGSLTTGLQLCEEGIPVVGVPKTIDNDLQATAMTFGFDSAVGMVVEGLDRLRTTAESHQRVMVVEVMGRHAGWIALHGGIGGGADVVLIPEIPFEIEKVAGHVNHVFASGHRSVLIVVAEGAHLEDGKLMGKEEGRANQQMLLGGIGVHVARQVEEMTGHETRDVRLGHLQRGGSPTALDRILGTRFGVKAVSLIKDKQFGRMVNYQSYHVGDVPIEDAVNKLRLVQPDSEVVMAARAVGISFGDR
ncbi:6-phosphofructokinase [Phragmitibacter flavus]|uniref:ATP-dependent 6-phosphofructokinase n=1 Tax=Phragmitibacter flavus TaxID=2576071 RepID=A0A5R8K8H4_9BACT|nr:ATP-dependent 6-phosphofructokinase [Phragmitibacter flavus]TLD68601.1 6-phosphofructokinase [Phragmitibacter flavus]